VLIGINGQIKGNVIYDMTRQTALALASRMYGTEITEITEEVTDSISELGNMVSGKASGILHSDSDIFFNITPPNIVFGEQTIVTNSTIDFIVVPLETNCGQVKINLAIKE
jgi:chemotaxis protein CheX